MTHLFELPVHLLYLLFHVANLRLAGIDLTLELFDLEIEDELEFL